MKYVFQIKMENISNKIIHFMYLDELSCIYTCGHTYINDKDRLIRSDMWY